MITFLEKKLKIDLRYFLGGGFWLFIGQIISTSESILISVFLARFFSMNDFGKFAYIMAVFSVVNVFGAPGMSVAIFQSVSRGFEGTFKYLLKKVFLIGLMGSIMLVLFQFYFNFVQGEKNRFIFIILAIIFPFYSVGIDYAYFISGIKKFKERTYFELLMNVFIIISFFIVFLLKKDIYFSIVSLLLSQTIITLAYVHYLTRKSNEKIDYNAYEYGRKLNWNYAIPTIKLQLDRVLISNSLGYVQTATYNIGYSFGDQVTTFAKILGALIIPKSSNFTKEEVKQKLNRKNVFILLLLLFSISIILILLCPQLIEILYGEKYLSAIPYAQAILFFIPLRSFSSILKNINESQKNIKILNIISNQLSILEIILMLLGLLFFQVWGLIFAKIISDSIVVILQLFYIYKK